MKLAFKLLILALAILPAFANPVDDEAKRLLWRDRALEEISSLKDFSEEENARKVAGYVAIAMGTNIRSLSGPQAEVFDAARKKFESIPGHAAFLEKELGALREERQKPTGSGDYNYDRSRIFTVLQCLQTAESVELLIRLLEDNRDAETFTAPGVAHKILGNDEMAGTALISSIKELPLERDRWGGYRQDIPTLQAWGREVREGKRTFKFKDNPGTFNISGRIPDEHRETSSIPRSPVTGIPDGDEASQRSFPMIWWVAAAAIAFLLAAVVKVLWAPKRVG